MDEKIREIKEHLKEVMPEDVYEKWISGFAFESIDKEKAVIGYYGEEPLKEFNKKYKQTVWMHICTVTGYIKKLEIYDRTKKAPKSDAPKKKKTVRAAVWFLLSLVFAVLAVCAAIMGTSYIVNRNFRETFYSVGSLRANNEIRIIEISDLHSSSYGKDNIKLKSRIEKLEPDIIIFTGDCVDQKKGTTDKIVSLGETAAKIAPAYYIYGNNEAQRFYGTAMSKESLDKKYGFTDNNRDASVVTNYEDELEKALNAVGVKVLKNEKDTVKIGDTTVDIYGVITSNPSSFWDYAGESFNEYIYNDTNNLKITAIHEPILFEEFENDTWGNLAVSSHTHGGMVKIPKLGPLYTHEGGLFPERKGGYIYGRYNTSGTPLIVSAGLENNSIFRINNRPELVVIDINKF